MHTELGRSQVEVQRCTLSWNGPRLRSSGAHWAGKLAKSLAQRVGEESWQRAGRRFDKVEVQVEVDADMVGEKLEEEARRRTRRKRTAIVEEEDEEEGEDAEEEHSDKI